MSLLSRWCRGVGALLLLGVMLGLPVRAEAQQAPSPVQLAANAKESKSYVNQYALVAMCLGLGLVLVCRPSKRTEKVKLEEDN